MIVVGAGLSGLIASAILRDKVSSIYDKQPFLPNNHSALLRFRTSIVGDAVGIPFRKVEMMKTSQPWKNPVADAVMYSKKATGTVRLRSSVTAKGKVEERFIAPNNLIECLGAMSKGKFHFKANFGIAQNDAVNFKTHLISTIPMPVLMKLLNYETVPNFKYFEGFTITCDLPESFDICVTVYYPDPEVLCYRASITEQKLILEFNQTLYDGYEHVPLEEWAADHIRQAIAGLGITDIVGLSYIFKQGSAKRVTYNKIAPIDEAARKRFLLWATEEHNIFSLGRFATWRPGLLLDDLVNDIRVIRGMADGSPSPQYKMRKSP